MIYVNDILITPTLFPDNTSQIWKLPEYLLNEKSLYVKWTYDSEGEFLQLAQLKALLDLSADNIMLSIDYLPYARQDKYISNNTTFALAPFAKLLNSLEFNEIIISDPHSLIAIGMIKNSESYYPDTQLINTFENTKSNVVCYPDKGAVNKYTKIYQFEHIYGEKVRDQSTGSILSYKLMGNPKDQNVLIVDDICDGGMTFQLLAKDLILAGATEVNLFVTHGIFSKGLRVLKEAGIKRVFTKDGEISEYQNGFTYRRL